MDIGSQDRFGVYVEWIWSRGVVKSGGCGIDRRGQSGSAAVVYGVCGGL